jgi:hypothetical protein
MPVSHEGLLPVIQEIFDTPDDSNSPEPTTLEAKISKGLLDRFFVVDRNPTYIRDGAPVSGHYRLDFTAEGGRQFARDLAHDLLLAAALHESVVVAEETRNIDKIANVLLATTSVDADTAKAQAKALFHAGINFPTAVLKADEVAEELEAETQAQLTAEKQGFKNDPPMGKPGQAVAK